MGLTGCLPDGWPDRHTSLPDWLLCPASLLGYDRHMPLSLTGGEA